MSGRPVHERDVVASLAALAMVVAAALVGLVSDANWPKVLRVALAFTAYSASCLFLFDVGGKPLQYWRFGLSAALAAVVSVSVNWAVGFNPAEAYPKMLAVTASAAAVLLGGVHYLAVRYCRRIAQAVTSRSVT